jgi:predicted DsbA family dithiol-disulfide isomerase
MEEVNGHPTAWEDATTRCLRECVPRFGGPQDAHGTRGERVPTAVPVHWSLALSLLYMRAPHRLLFLALLPLAGGWQQDPVASRSMGHPEAPVTVYEMSDFQCPFCRQFALTTLPVIEQNYIRTGKVRWVFVNFPLTRLHKNAVAAAQVAMCAARQGKFWPVHDRLYRDQPQWAPLDTPWTALIALADSAGVRHDSLVTCLSSRATMDEIARDAQGAARAGATATPSFYIEGGLADGDIPPTDFSHILDSVYRAKTGGGAAHP